MSRISLLIACSLLTMLLVGCSVTIDLQPHWRHSPLYFHTEKGQQEQVIETPAVTMTHTVSNTSVVTDSNASTVTIQGPIHIVDMRPLTTTSPFSLTALVDLESIGYVEGCTVNRALGRAPSSFNDSTVVAAITHISGTVPLNTDDGNSRAVFAPNLDRTLYWSSDTGQTTPDCSPSATWLWQQIAVLPDQDNGVYATPAVLSLPATTACHITDAFTPEAFGTMLNNRGEWPDLLYVLDADEKPALLVLAQAQCEQPSGCTKVRTICQSLFEEGVWQEWCTSVCS